MKQTGIGVDIFEIARMRRALARHPKLKQQLFSDEEIRYAEAAHSACEHFSAFFAAKEAVVKALGLGFCPALRPLDISITHDRAGKPQVVFSDAAKKCVDELNIAQVVVSLSHTQTLAIANALALPELPHESPQAPLTPEDKMRLSYKQALHILDEFSQQEQLSSPAHE